MSIFTFARLNPAYPANEGQNAALLGAQTLGVEVTDRRFASLCGLGNIDPQHAPGATGGLAAVEAAINWPLPPPGTRIITLRADADALGAMAVLLLRGEGRELGPDALARIDAVARWDKLARGSWEMWQRAHPPLLRPAMAVDLRGKPLEMKAVDALVRLNAWTMQERVVRLAAWLLRGQAELPTDAVHGALDFEAALLDAWNRKAIDARATDDPHIAVLLSAPDAPVGGMDLAYRLAPVVLAEGHMPWGRKLTVAQFAPGWVNLPALLGDLRGLEPGWGGQPQAIIGSTQGTPTALSLAEIYRLAKRHLHQGDQAASI